MKIKNRDKSTASLVAACKGIAARRKRDNTAKKPRRENTPGDAPTEAQLANGDYDRGFTMNSESNTKATTYRRRDTVQRWHDDGKLSDLQMSTIEHMETLWYRVYGLQKVTGSYSEPLGAQSSGDGTELAENARNALREELRAIEGLFDGLRQWYGVFERICRFNHTPMEACGSREGALATVKFVADFIEVRK